MKEKGEAGKSVDKKKAESDKSLENATKRALEGNFDLPVAEKHDFKELLKTNPYAPHVTDRAKPADFTPDFSGTVSRTQKIEKKLKTIKYSDKTESFSPMPQTEKEQEQALKKQEIEKEQARAKEQLKQEKKKERIQAKKLELESKAKSQEAERAIRLKELEETAGIGITKGGKPTRQPAEAIEATLSNRDNKKDIDALNKLSAYIIQTTPTQRNASEFSLKIKEYSTLSEKLEKKKSQNLLGRNLTTQVNTIRYKTNHELDIKKRQLPKLIEAETVAQRKYEEQRVAQNKEIAAARTTCNELLEQVNRLAQEYVDASLDDMEGIYKDYNKLKDTMNRTAGILPDKDFYTIHGVKEPEARIQFGHEFKIAKGFAKTHELANDITRTEDYNSYLKQARKLTKRIAAMENISQVLQDELKTKVEQLSKTVEERFLYIGKLIQKKDRELKKHLEKNKKLVGEMVAGKDLETIFISLAPQPIQEALQYIQENPDIINDAIGDNQELKAALKAITAQDTAGDLSLSQYNTDEKLGILDLQIRALESKPEYKNELAALKYLRKTIENIQKLSSGDASHMTFLHASGTNVKMVHVDFETLMNPGKLTSIVNNFLGMGKGSISIKPTNPQEIAILNAFADQIPSLMQGKQALDQISGAHAGSLTQSLMHVFNGVLGKTQGLDLMAVQHNPAGILDVMLMVSSNPKAMTQVLGNQRARALQEELAQLDLKYPKGSHKKIDPKMLGEIIQNTMTIVKTVNDVVALTDGPIGEYVSEVVRPGDDATGSVEIVTINKEAAKSQELPQMLAYARGSVATDTTVAEIFNKMASDDTQYHQEERDKQDADTKIINDFKRQCAIYEANLNDLKILTQSKSTDPAYSELVKVSTVLETTLENLGAFFKKDPTQKTFPKEFETFSNEVKAAFKLATPEFKKHRGPWYSLDPIIRNILGVLSVLALLIPALVVHFTTEKGFMGTFFDTPKTRSHGQLKEIKGRFFAGLNEASKGAEGGPEGPDPENNKQNKPS